MRSCIRRPSLLLSLAVSGVLSGCFSSTRTVETVPVPGPVVQVPAPIVQVPPPVVMAPPLIAVVPPGFVVNELSGVVPPTTPASVVAP